MSTSNINQKVNYIFAFIQYLFVTLISGINATHLNAVCVIMAGLVLK